MKKLPEIYKKEIQKKIKNNKEYTYVQKEKQTNFDLENTLFEIFHSGKNLTRKKVMIQTKNHSYETYLLGKTKDAIITFENDYIPKKDILRIQFIDEKNL